MDVTKIPDKLPESIEKEKVAAYARVSTKSDAQLHSLNAQIDYYRKKINARADWSFVGVFVDDGLTGTRSDRRGLEDLMDNCRRKKIDLVLTKSISRFARNTVDLLAIIRELKELGIAVFFEREKINTLTADGELMLTLLASFAQEESRSMSLNKRWSIHRQFSEGELAGMAHLYGYDVVDGELIVNGHEAEIVSMMYEDYLSGMQSSEIAEKLNRMGEPRKRGEQPQYYIENSHEGIISQELFDAVQEEMKRRSPNKGIPKPHNKPFTGMIHCACGAKFQRKQSPVRVFWRCGRNLGSYGGHCSMKGIPEETLESLCCDVLGISEFDANTFRECVERINITGDNELTFLLKDGSEIHKTWKDRSRSESWTPEMRAEVSRKNRERAKYGK